MNPSSKLLIPGRSSRLYFSALAMWLSVSAVKAVEIYFAPVTPSAVVQAVGPVQTNASGLINLGASLGTAMPAAQSTGGIRLVEASISPTVASPQGYSSQVQDSLASARISIRGAGPTGLGRTAGAAEYRYGSGQNGKETLWDIKFDQVPDYVPAQDNFIPEKLTAAIDKARIAIRANPYLTGKGSGYEVLFEAAYEATIPLTFAGNAWRALAERERTNVAGNPLITDRITRLQTAASRYRAACQPLLDLLNHPSESRILLAPRTFLGDAAAEWGTNTSLWDKTWDNLLSEAYIQALSQLAETQFELLHTQYFKDYRAPEVGVFDRNALIASIQAAADEIDILMLPITALASKGLVNARFDMATPTSGAAKLRSLADNVQEFALSFSPGSNPRRPGSSFNTYGPSYVPFLVPVQLQQQPFTFDNFRDFVYGSYTVTALVVSDATAGSLIGTSKAADAVAYTTINDVIDKVEKVDALKTATQNEYEKQLSQLCGARRSDPANPASTLVPDIVAFLLPPEDREALGSGESLGDIVLQWAKIDQSETRLLSAFRSLAEIDEEAAIIRQYGDQRLISYERIANIQLSTGQKISALDYLSGESRAQAIEHEAEARARRVKKKNWWSTAASAVSSFNGGSAWGVVGNLTTVGLQTYGQIQSAKTDAQLFRQVGQIQADATRRQSTIQAQQTRIRAAEGAQITMEQGGQEENRIKEAIHKLMIRVERQKLEVLLAQQQVEFAELEHANMVGRISYLIEEYRRVSIRQAASTLNRPDIRLRRDWEIQEANRKFRVAQEYSFLLAKSADYRFGVKPGALRSQIATQTEAILKAQNAKQLETAVRQLITVRETFLTSETNGMAGLKEVRFSLRDVIAQSNHVDAAGNRALNGSWITGRDDSLLQPYAQAVLGGTVPRADLSDQQFTTFLQRNLIPDPAAPGSSILRLRFAIGYEPEPFDPNGVSSLGRVNLLRTETTGQFGHVIEGNGPTYAASGAVGVFLNIRNRSTIPIGFPSTATLKPVGTFYTTVQANPAPTAPVEQLRAWNPANADGESALDNSVRIIHNGDTITPGWRARFGALVLEAAGSKLHERSPANDHWLLEIKTATSRWNDYLPNVRDIEVCMTIRGW